MPIEDHFSDNIKMNMLQNPVMGVKVLDNVKDLQNHDKAQGIQSHTYSAYLSLLLSAATTLDSQRGLIIGCTNFYPENRKLSINKATVDYDSDNKPHNIDSYLISEVEISSDKNKTDNDNTTLVHRTKSTPCPFINGPKMSKDKCVQISILINP